MRLSTMHHMRHKYPATITKHENLHGISVWKIKIEIIHTSILLKLS